MEGDLKTTLQKILAGELCGVGWRNEKKLIENGINSCWDFAEADRLFVRKMLIFEVLVRREVFVLTQVSSHYYKILTRNPRMAVFVAGNI